MNLPKVPQRTTPGFAFSVVERALLECLAPRQFGSGEIKQVLSFFGFERQPECVYCGSHDVKRWDHLVPIKEGGETVLGNMVPACALCDDSKRHLPYQQWMLSDTKSSLKNRGINNIRERIMKIQAYSIHYEYRPRSLVDRLDDHDIQRLEDIRAKLKDVRGDIDTLIKDYRSKTGSM
ncbi:MAG: HNH endonuclease signature motif containing protein [Candidatus Promineifilaceae bacterium]